MFQNPDPAYDRTLATKCYGCNKEKAACERLNKCSACKAITYCSKECQTNHWNEHKQFCKMIKKCPEFFQDDYDGYAYRRYIIFQATKDIQDQKEKDLVEMAWVRDLMSQNLNDFCSQKCFSLEGLMALKESLLIDLAHCKRDKSIAFMQTPRAAYTLLQISYFLMTNYQRLQSVFIRHVRDFLRLLSQMLCHPEAAVQFIRLLEADAKDLVCGFPTSDSLLQLLVKFMTEFDEVADDVEGLAWLCLALTAIHRDNLNVTSTIIEDTLNMVQQAGREAHIIPQLFNLAKLHANQTLMR